MRPSRVLGRREPHTAAEGEPVIESRRGDNTAIAVQAYHDVPFHEHERHGELAFPRGPMTTVELANNLKLVARFRATFRSSRMIAALTESPMDPATLATAAVTALTPYLAKAGEQFAKEAGKQGFAIGEAILKALWGRWRGKQEAETRLDRFIQDPEAGREGLTMALVAEVASDKTFAEALQTLLQGGSPAVFVDQTAGDVKELTGAEINEMIRGRLTVHQNVEKGDKITGAKIEKLG
jgi:hypothetical protein